MSMATLTLIVCQRCLSPVVEGVAEFCWWCGQRLCFKCWDDHGHCGHSEADAMNARAASDSEGEP